MNKYIQPTNALLLQSMLCVGLLGFRYLFTGWQIIDWGSPQIVVNSRGITFLFLVWNLLLAWVPYWLAGSLKDKPLKYGLPLLALWLLFFPNAPYIITDLMHIKARHPVPTWYDAMLIFSFAWTGLLLGVSSLHKARKWVSSHFGWVAGNFFSAIAILLCGFGLYLGRFLRWNSWDLFTQPLRLAESIIDLVAHALSHPIMLVVTLAFTLIMGGSYTVMLAIAQDFITPNKNENE